MTRIYKASGSSGAVRLSAVDIRSSNTDETFRVPCRALIISAGSWSTSVLSSLFPSASLKIPMAERQPVQTWLRFSKSTKKHEGDGCEQVWLNPLRDNVNIHVSSFRDGELYAAGDIELGDTSPPVPQFVQPSPTDISGLSKLVADYVDLSDGRTLVRSGRAYMPRTAHGRPVMA